MFSKYHVILFAYLPALFKMGIRGLKSQDFISHSIDNQTDRDNKKSAGVSKPAGCDCLKCILWEIQSYKLNVLDSL